MFTWSARTLSWAPPRFYQLRHDPPGETEVLIAEDKGMFVEQEEAIEGHYKSEVFIGALGGSSQIL